MEFLLSKKKIRRNLIASVVLFVPCVLAAFVYGIVWIVALCLGAFCIYYWWKLVQVETGFVIDEYGIIDNSGVFAFGFIPWSDIRNLTVLTVKGQKVLVIGIGNPQLYIEREAGLKKTTFQYNYRSYGSPFIVSANGLGCTLDELKAAIEGKQKERSSRG